VIDLKLAEQKVAAEIHGSGPTLILFHSLLADRSSFDRVAGPLAAHFRVVLPSLPGFPGSEFVDDHLAAVADRMAEAVREVAAGEQSILLGNGYGGFVALLLAIRHPGLITRLVVSDAGAAFSQAGREAFRTMSRVAGDKGLGAVADVAMRRLFAPDFHAANPELVAERRRRFIAMDKAVFLAACRELAALDLRSQLAQVTIPVLALVGEQDEATPPVMSREMVALLPAAELIVLPGCAHVPQLQAPDQFLAAAMPFLSVPESKAAGS